MNILILSWRDIKNPFSGGAEILTHEISKRLVKKGHRVVCFSSSFKNCSEKEIIDGVEIVRKGNPDARYFFSSVHFKAFLYYIAHFRGKVDVVVDEIHGLPFFTPFYVKEKKIALICEVAGEIWDQNFPFPFNVIGRFIEKAYFLFYRNITFFTISLSTKTDLESFGVKGNNVRILPMGITTSGFFPKHRKEGNTTIIFVGRLVKSKGIEDAIKALAIVKKKFPLFRFWIVGRGNSEYLSRLKKLILKKRLTSNTAFFGFVEENRKFELMSKAHFLLAPSVKEGWGLIVPEAGLVGVPAIGYDVHGIREVIKNNKTGYLAPKSNFVSLAATIEKALRNKKMYNKMSVEVSKLSKTYNWDNTVKAFLNGIKNNI
jgi:glycosyltransferase involved in cell wall biosynthesis